MIDQVAEKIDGFHGKYTDSEGNSCRVKGTFALGPCLSWHTEDGNWVEIEGEDQGYVVDRFLRILPE